MSYFHEASETSLLLVLNTSCMMLGTWRNSLLIEKQNIVTKQSISQPGGDPMQHDYKNHCLVVLRMSSNHVWMIFNL